MSIILYRVDDRLIHGQVTVGWARALQPESLIVVDDEVAGNTWEEMLFKSAVPDPMKVIVWSTEEAIKNLPDVQSSKVKKFLLTRSLLTMVTLIREGNEIPSVNLGGLHYSHGKIQVLPYISLGEEDLELLLYLKDKGVEIDVRDVPTTENKNIFDLLKSRGLS